MQNNQAIPFNKENFKLIFSKEFALVIIISIPSAILAEFFNIPLAWFLGPMLATSVASLFGLKIKMPKLILSIILILLGLYIGNYIDKSLFSQIHQWAWTSLIMLIYIVISWVMGSTVPGWTSLSLSIYALFSINFLLIGLQGEYLGKTYFQTLRRPRYIIQEISNNFYND